MKICFFAPGRSVHSYRWIEYFSKKGHQIHWFSLEPFEQGIKIENISFYYYPVKKSPLKFLHLFLVALKIKKMLKIIKPNVLHVHSVAAYGFLELISGFHPCVATAWGSDVLMAQKCCLRKYLARRILKTFDFITTDALHMIKAMIKLGADKNKMKIIYFGVDTEKFSPRAKNIDLVKSLGIEDKPVIISLRTLRPVYNIETLIKSVVLVCKVFPQAQFVIAGTGPEEKKLKDLAHSLSISSNIKFVGNISIELIPDYLNSSDLYVSTSLSDAGIAASTAEAMASAVPVIVTNSGENVRWVEDGKMGFVIPIKSPEILAEKIIYLLENEQARKDMGLKARALIEEKNCYDKEMAKMQDVYLVLGK